MDSYEENREEFIKLELYNINPNSTNLTAEDLIFKEKEFMGVDSAPKPLVLLLLVPDGLVLIAFLLLFC